MFCFWSSFVSFFFSFFKEYLFFCFVLRFLFVCFCLFLFLSFLMIFLLLFYFLFCFVFFVVFFLLVSFLLLFCCCCFGFYKTEERKQLKSIIYDTFFIVFFSNFLTYQTRLPTIKSWNCSGFNVHRVILKPLILLTDCLTGRSQAKSQNTKFLSQSPFWKYSYAPDVIILFNSALSLLSSKFVNLKPSSRAAKTGWDQG